ncbi:unnamed protein product [Peniophora sp. CBMAI 1063]|nr:unnamed protein product [Peniophora sp. CBMAI 1063]
MKSNTRASDFGSLPPHPLIYASLEPCYSPSFVQRIDLHRPQTRFTLGRSPQNDFVLEDRQSGQIDWVHCTIALDEEGVRLTENHTTNGIWVNGKRLSPGEPCVLQDGDSVRFGRCQLACYDQHERGFGYERGRAYSYTFRSFISRSPPGLSAVHQGLREQYERLERKKAALVAERARLERGLHEIEDEASQIVQSMPPVPPTKLAVIEKRNQNHYARLAMLLREDYPGFFPEDIRDFRPQPWLLPVVGPEHPIPLHEMHRSFGAIPIEQPPPLEKDSRIFQFNRAMHDSEAPDWNDPEVVWGDLQYLNLSSPLMIPPSIIFWSIEYALPVYMHPKFPGCSRKGPYAHPYAQSEYVFSDESAAAHRAELGLQPLENPTPLRPTDALMYRVKTCRTVPDEDDLAEWVELLSSRKRAPASSREPSPEASSPVGESPPPTLAPASIKRPRASDAVTEADSTAHHSSEERSASPTLALSSEHDDHAHDEGPDKLVGPGHPLSQHPADTPIQPLRSKSSSDKALVSRDSAATRPPKRRKTSHSSMPSPTMAVGAPTAPHEGETALRTSPEPEPASASSEVFHASPRTTSSTKSSSTPPEPSSLEADRPPVELTVSTDDAPKILSDSSPSTHEVSTRGDS